MFQQKRDSLSHVTDENNNVMNDTDPKMIVAVLNSYAHGATTEQSAKSAGVDVATAHKIIEDVIAAQQSLE